MRDAIRAELLKARGSWWMLFGLAYAYLMPAMCYSYAPDSVIATDGADSAAATRTLLAFLTAVPVASIFLANWGIAKEYFYRSLPRTALTQRRIDGYVAKYVSGAAQGLVVGVLGTTAWSVSTWIILEQRHQSFDLGAATWQTLVLTVVASVLAGPWGVTLGYLLPNYWTTTAAALIAPFALELPLMLHAPSIGRFLPVSTLAGVVQPPIPGLLPPLAAAVASLLWIAASLLGGWRLFRRRDLT
ncbi:hypothetical protein [Streptomyces sp. NPDC050355]|uniref:hypothetical protein n=1 Tax=Streptomyces sp. NPDC050355 TaxID=3365609 RepID=UPI00378C378C